MDRLVLRATPQGDERECVACGFSDRISDSGGEPQDLSLLPAGKLDAIATARKVAPNVTDAAGRDRSQPVRMVEIAQKPTKTKPQKPE